MPRLSEEKISSIVTASTNHCLFLLAEEFELEGEEFPRQMLKTMMLAEMGAVLRKVFGDDGEKGSRKGTENDVKLETLEGMIGNLTKLVTGMARELSETKENGCSALEILKSWQSGEEVQEREESLSVWDEFQDAEETDQLEEVTSDITRGKKRKAQALSTKSGCNPKQESIDSPNNSSIYQRVNRSTACFQPVFAETPFPESYNNGRRSVRSKQRKPLGLFKTKTLAGMGAVDGYACKWLRFRRKFSLSHTENPTTRRRRNQIHQLH